MTHIEQRLSTAAAWTLANPVLHPGEAGHESDTGKWKLGDGVTPWNALPYKAGVDSVAGRTGNVSLVVGDVAGAAPKVSPALTGMPTAPTPSVGENSTRLATTKFVKDVLAASPALGGTPTAPTQAVAANGDSIATTKFVKDQAYATLASPALTGAPTAPTQAGTDNSTRIATTAHVKSALSSVGVWADYPVSILGGSIGVGAKVGRYTRIGNTVHYRVGLTLGTGFNISGLSVGLPFNMSPTYLGSASLSGHHVEVVDVGTANYRLIAYGAGAGYVTMWVPGTSGAYQSATNAAPFTWANGDVINFFGSYECTP